MSENVCKCDLSDWLLVLDGLVFTHNNLYCLHRMGQKTKNIQWVEVQWVKGPCWLERSEEKVQTSWSCQEVTTHQTLIGFFINFSSLALIYQSFSKFVCKCLSKPNWTKNFSRIYKIFGNTYFLLLFWLVFSILTWDEWWQ